MFAYGIALGLAVLGWAGLASPVVAAEVRHYERVSPADKGDGDVIAEGEAIVASSAGDAATFDSRMVFGDAVGSGNVGRTTYLARRGDDGSWSTHSITPASRPEAVQILFASTKVEVFSDDLSTALVWGYDLPGVSGDTPNRENLYVEDTATGELRPISVSQVDPLFPFDFLDPNIWGVSADAKHVAFVTATQMLPDAAQFTTNAYKWDDGTLSVAGVLPDGSVPSGGSTIEPTNVRNTMSVDGTRLVFRAPADFSTPPQLYMHVDGGRTIWISQPEGSDRSDPTGVAYEGMTPDGKNVFFVSSSPLLDGDTAPGPDLYRYTDSADPANDSNLTLITNTGSALNDPTGFGGALVGMSDDGRRVYVHELTNDLEVWENGATTTIDSVPKDTDRRHHLTVTATQPGYARVSPDGNWLAYIKNDRMYLYNLSEDDVTCVSCPSDASLVPTLTNSGRVDFTAFRPRFLTADGQVFFTSTGSLVPQDTNGVADVYEYDGVTGVLSLLTSGKGRDAAMFVDASVSGDDVFVVTRQQLVAADRDQYIDLYDVRVGAAPPDQPVDSAPSCEGDACQGATSAAPADDVLGSLSLEGDEAKGARPGLMVRHRVVLRGAAGALSVRLGGAGKLKWSGRGVVAGSVKHGAGAVKLRLRLNHRARAQLRRAGRYVTTVRLTFLAADGNRTTETIHVTFKAVAKKGR